MSAEHAHQPALMPHEWPEDRDFGRATTGKVGMWVFLLSDAFMFGGFLLAYGILRGGSAQWISEGEPRLGINFTACLTFLLICSSVTMVLSYAALIEKNIKAGKFASLQNVFLDGTRVTKEGVGDIREALPACYFEW